MSTLGDQATGGDRVTGGDAPTVGSVGENEVVDRVTAVLGRSGRQGPGGPCGLRGLREQSRTVVGPGDDAAVVLAPDGRVVATTDVLVEGVHFRRDWSSAHDVGHKAAAANLADVVAMGATPTALLVGLAAPAHLPLDWVLELASGLAAEAALVGAEVVGGDTVRADGLMVSVTALGDLAGRAPVLRSGARPGDLLVHAGRLGWAAAGLADLLAGQREGRRVDAHRRPAPPDALGVLLAAAGATAMMDVSDGLVQDLTRLATASGVSIELDTTLLPEDGIDVQDQLTGGEDHGLVAAVPPGTVLPQGVQRIGTVAAGTPGLRVLGTQPVGQGWTHW